MTQKDLPPVVKLPKEENVNQENRNEPGIGTLTEFSNYLDLARLFIEKQPMYYDDSKIWWVWDRDKNCYVQTDDVDIMNDIEDSLERTHEMVTVRSTTRNEILEALRRVARRNRPTEFPKTWVQFRNAIVDVSTGKHHLPSPEYFCANPIPWSIAENGDTPTIDKIFTEWVGQEWVPTLKEIIAYAMLPDYPVHRIFALVGAGSNGKGCFLELLKRMVGSHNTVSTSLERLVSGRFETSKLLKKSVCLIGETNVKMLEKTDILKRASGGDLIPGEIKNKNPFDFKNYAKIIVATNSLPVTTDRTDGFYRRWLSIDFPNRFPEETDVLATIPEIEYGSLAKQCIELLQNFLVTRTFHNEGTIEDRKQRYEERSDPVQMLIRNDCIKDVNGSIVYAEFVERLNEHIKNKGLRTMSPREITSILRNSMGLDTKNVNIKIGDKKTTQKHIIGVRWKLSGHQGNIDSIDNIGVPIQTLCKDFDEGNDIIDTIDTHHSKDNETVSETEEIHSDPEVSVDDVEEFMLKFIEQHKEGVAEEELYRVTLENFEGKSVKEQLECIVHDRLISNKGLIHQPSPGILQAV